MSDINVTVQDQIVNIDVLDTPVLVNVVNSPGQQGPAGPGVPVGGTAGQVLKKLSATNYDTYWAVDAGGVTSVGLTMPSAFAVANSPITSAGTLSVTATGDTTQYIAGDGSLVAFPITGQAGTLVREVRNNSGATITKGTVVYINGASGNRPTIAKAIATGDATSAQTFGLVQADISNNANGYIVAFGDLDGLDTSAITEGSQLYLSSTVLGGYTTVKQYAPNHLVYIGVVTRSHPTQGRIEVRIQNGYEMDELHDVSAQTPTNNQGLFYNSSNSLWENKSISTVLGFTPEQPLTFNSPLSRSVNAVSIPQATGSVNGFLSATDWTTFNSKQAALGFTPANAATTLTINGVTFDLSANRSWTVAAGISGSGASGQVTYWTGASAVSGNSGLTWNNTDKTLNILQSQNVFGSLDGFTVNDSSNIQANFSLKGGTAANSPRISISSLSNALAAPVGGTGLITNYVDGNSFHPLRFLGSRIDFETTASTYTSRVTMMRVTPTTVLIGSTSDNGQRLQVYGDTLLRGSGSTISTTALTVQNSSSTNLLRVLNNGDVSFGADAMFWDAANGRLGIGTNAPAVNLDILGTSSTYLRVTRPANTFDAAFVTTPSGALSASNVSWNYGLQFGSNNFRFWYWNGTTSTTALNITNTGNVHIGSGTDATVRLQVSGDTLLRGSGASSTTTALTVQNSSSTNLFTVRNDRTVTIHGANITNARTDFPLNVHGGMSITATGTGGDGLAIYAGGATIANINLYIGAVGFLNSRSSLRLGAANNTDVVTEITNTWLTIAAGTTTRSQIRLASSTAPTSPNDGDIWFDGTNIQMRIGGVTKTFTLV